MKWVKKFTRSPAPLANTASAVEYRLWQKSLDARWGNGFYNDWRGQYFSELHPRRWRSSWITCHGSSHRELTSKSPTWRVL
jgi:hypothetical protein